MDFRTLIMLALASALVCGGRSAFGQDQGLIDQYRTAQMKGETDKAARLALKIGASYSESKRYRDAASYYSEAHTLTNGDRALRIVHARAKLGLGRAYLEIGRDADAGPLFEEASLAFEQEGYDSEFAEAEIGMASVEISMTNYKQAGERLTRVRSSVEGRGPERLKAECYRLLAEAYEGIGQTQNALRHYKMYAEAIDKATRSRIADIRRDYEERRRALLSASGDKERELMQAQETLQQQVQSEQNRLDSLQKMAEGEAERIAQLTQDLRTTEEANQRNIALSWILGVAFVIMLGIAGATIFFYRRNQIIAQELAEQKDALEEASDELLAKSAALQENAGLLAEQNEELEAAKVEVERSSQRMLDSVRYAEQIQSIILPDTSKLDEAFSEHFVVFRPKDIVSGDFYWISVKEDLAIVAAVDCTGHGVPGGFMSMIGSTLLNELVNYKYIHDPAYILNELHSEVRKTLKQESGVNDDGMDVSLVMLEKSSKRLTFCGAKRPLYIVRNGELQELKGNKKSIGGMQKEMVRVFEQHEEHLCLPGDMLYLTTDGFADQNDKQREKYGRTRLADKLTEIASLPAEEQRAALEASLDEFQGGAEQRDDITVVGLKV